MALTVRSHRWIRQEEDRNDELSARSLGTRSRGFQCMGRAAARDLAREGVNILGVHFDTASGQEKAAVTAEELRSLGVEVRFFNENAARADVRARLVTEFAEITSGSGIRILMHSLAFGA